MASACAPPAAPFALPDIVLLETTSSDSDVKSLCSRLANKSSWSSLPLLQFFRM